MPAHFHHGGASSPIRAWDVSLQPVSHPHIQPAITSNGEHDVEEDQESGDDCEDSAPSRLVWMCKGPGHACEHKYAANGCKDPSRCWILSLVPHHD
jgi:hypothetical protein